MKVRFEDYEDDNLDRLPNLERIQKKIKEEKVSPPKEKLKKRQLPRLQLIDEEYD